MNAKSEALKKGKKYLESMAKHPAYLSHIAKNKKYGSYARTQEGFNKRIEQKIK